MESFDRLVSPQGTPDSRRARRNVANEGRQKRSTAKTPRNRGAHSAGRPHRFLGKTGVLASLAVVTIAMPLTAKAGQVETFNFAGGAEGITTYQVLTTKRMPEATPIIVADAQLISAREASSADRSQIRSPIDCDYAPVTSSNGRLTSAELCSFPWAPGYSQQGEAANALSALNAAYRIRFGKNICLSSGYRTFESQSSLSVTKPGLAAAPGRSMHGWGLAVDLCASSYTSAVQWNWLKANGPIFGYDNPAWARPGGSGAYEPWHWEYFPIVNKLS